MRRSSELSDVDHAAVRRLVTGAFQRVIATGGQSLGEVSFAAMHLSYEASFALQVCAFMTEHVLATPIEL